MVRQYEIEGIDGGVRVNGATQFHITYTRFYKDGREEKCVFGPIYAQDEIDAYKYFKKKMEW